MPEFGVYASDTFVIYTGRTEEFDFIPDTTSLKLFDNFKDVVPGDKLSQKITVRNTSVNTVEIFLRAEAVETRFKNFLSEINLTVTVEPNLSWYNAPASDMGTAGMSANRSLGSFSRGSDLDITVNLSIPITWGNEFQGVFGEVIWIFTVIEEGPTVTPPVSPPYTPPPVTYPPVTAAPPVTEPAYNYDILKPVPETQAIPETVPVTGPETIIRENEPVPLGSAGTEAPLPPNNVPPTGDEAEIIIWCAAAVLLTLMLTVLLYYRKRSGK